MPRKKRSAAQTNRPKSVEALIDAITPREQFVRFDNRFAATLNRGAYSARDRAGKCIMFAVTSRHEMAIGPVYPLTPAHEQAAMDALWDLLKAIDPPAIFTLQTPRLLA